MAVLVNEIGKDAVTTLRPAAMLARRRNVVWIALNPVGLIMRKHDGRKQGADNSRYDDGGPLLHLALPRWRLRDATYGQRLTRWRTHSCPVPRLGVSSFQLNCKSGE